MNKLIVIVFCSCIYACSFGQKLKVEAQYYNSKGKLYNIDRKYTDSSGSTIYAEYSRNEAACVKLQYSKTGDTTVVKENYYRIHHARTRLDDWMACHKWIVTHSDNDTFITYTGYIDDKPFGDTSISKRLMEDYDYLPDMFKDARLASLLNDKAWSGGDSLEPAETVITYFLHGIVMKNEVFDEQGKMTAQLLNRVYKNTMVSERYFAGESWPYRVDTISWNKDTSQIVWSSVRAGMDTSTLSYQIQGNVLTMKNGRGVLRKLEYAKGTRIFENLLIDRMVRNDKLFSMELMDFDRQKILKIANVNGQVKNRRYLPDARTNIIEQQVFDQRKMIGRVVYKIEK